MKQSQMTGIQIYNEIDRVTSELADLDKALDEIADAVGEEGLPYNIMNDARTEKARELQKLKDVQYTPVPVRNEGFDWIE